MNLAPFYSFDVRAAADGDEPTSAELMIFDVIGNWEEIGEVSAKAFAKSLAELPSSVRRLDIHINSPGGSVYDAQGIYSRLADHRAEKHVYIDGLAASAASIVAMVGHKIYMRANANMMIHLPMAITMGNEDDHDKSIRALRSITGAMLNTYAKKTGLGRGEIRDMLAAETWFTAEEAVEKGFADEVRGVIKATAVSSTRAIFNGREFDLSRFRNIPASVAAQQTERTADMPEKPKPTAAAPPAEPAPPPPKPDTPPAPPPPTDVTAAAAPPAPPPAPAKPNDFDRGITSERDRVLALQKLDRPATHAIVTAAIKDGKQPSDILAECMDAMDKANKQTARHADARTLEHIPPSDGADNNDDDGFGALLKSKVNSRLKARGQRVLNSQN